MLKFRLTHKVRNEYINASPRKHQKHAKNLLRRNSMGVQHNRKYHSHELPYGRDNDQTQSSKSFKSPKDKCLSSGATNTKQKNINHHIWVLDQVFNQAFFPYKHS